MLFITCLLLSYFLLRYYCSYLKILEKVKAEYLPNFMRQSS